MKLVEIRLPKEPDKSFIFYHDASTPFAQWHNHPEYELVLVVKGKGKRTVGDVIDRFDENDLIFLGPYLPHEWCCDQEYFTEDGFNGECVVLQFDQGFLGNTFFQLPENKPLQKILQDCSMGCKFPAAVSDIIIPMMKKMIGMDDTDRLYSLLAIFQVLAKATGYETLSTPHFIETFQKDENESLKKCVQYILQNFHENVPIKKMLDITHMSNSVESEGGLCLQAADRRFKKHCKYFFRIRI
jgi:23S rRNA U2552 (ribose-2'-O)-methylase RlmE/FtsJ